MASQEDSTKYSKMNLYPFSLNLNHMISLISGIKSTSQMKLSTEKKVREGGKGVVVGGGEGEGVGGIGSLGLMDANYCLWKGLAMRSCFVALGTISSHV